MGKPIILYGLEAIENASFEQDDHLDPPTGWDVTGVNEIAQVTEDEFHSAGDGIPSEKGLRMMVADSTSGNYSLARQRVQPSDLMAVSRGGDVELGLMACFKPATQTAADNSVLRVRQYSGGTSMPGTGTLKTAPFSRGFASAGPEWYLRAFAFKLHDDTDWLDLELLYDMDRGGYEATAWAYWDRVFFGGLVDLSKGFREFEPRQDAGLRVNEGDGEAEVLRLTGPSSQIDLEIRNVLRSSADWAPLAAFNRWLGRGVGFVAVWGDRDYLTNEDRHFQRCVPDDKFRARYPRGILRRDYDFRLIVPNEGTA